MILKNLDIGKIKTAIRKFEFDFENSHVVVEQDGQKIELKKDPQLINKKLICHEGIAGEIIDVTKTVGSIAKAGEVIGIYTALTHEHNIIMPEDGIISNIFVETGEIIDYNKMLFEYIPRSIP